MSVMRQGAALVKPQHIRECVKSLRDELISCALVIMPIGR